MLNLHRRSSALRAAIAGPVILLALAACGGGSDSTATPAASATGAPAAEGAPGGGAGGGMDFTAIQACLKAAGIEVATPSGMPSAGASRGPRPSGTFSGTPGARPSGGGGFGGGGGMFQSKEAQAALKACGITIPTGRGNRPTATPTS